MPAGLVTINIKRDMPTVEEARRRLETQLKELAGQGCPVVKVIHGYGSTGVGGKIRHGLTTTFRRLQREKIIRSSIPGEQWKATNPVARKLIAEFPQLKRDPDLGRNNPGVTIVHVAAKTPRKRAPRDEGTSKVAPLPDVDRLIKADPEAVYDHYSRPDMIRRLKPES